MKFPKQFSTNIVDLLVKLVFAGIAAVLTPLIFRGSIAQLAYVWLVSILILAILLIRDYGAYRARPFARRFRNEEEAMATIQKMVEQSQGTLCVLSKVGTSVFFLFRQYSKLLENEHVIQVLIADPEDAPLITLMDKIYVQQNSVANRWARLLSEIHAELEVLHGDGSIPPKAHESLKAMLSENGGYRDLINASIFMWGLALSMANERLRTQEKPVTVHGLEIRVYGVLPDLKAWIVDNECCAVGHYSAIHLGRDNPIDIYQPSKSRAMEHWQFDNVLEVWNYKFEKSHKLEKGVTTLED